MSRRNRNKQSTRHNSTLPSAVAGQKIGVAERIGIVIAASIIALMPWLGGRLPLDADPVPTGLLSIISGMASAAHLAPLALCCIAAAWVVVLLLNRSQTAAAQSQRVTGAILAVATALYTIAWLASHLRGLGIYWYALWMLCVAMALWSARSTWGITVTCAGLWLAGLGVSRQVMWEHAVNDVGWRCFGPFMTPNMLAAFLCLSLPLSLMVAVYAVNHARRDNLLRMLTAVLCVSVVLIQGVAMIYTGSRFGAVAGGVGLLGALIGLAYARQFTKRAVMVCLLVIVVWSISYLRAGQALSSRVVSSADTQAHSGAFRMMTWKGALRMIQARPVLGFGPGSFDTAYPRYALVGFTRLAHSAPLQAASESGVPYAVLLYVLGAAVWVAGWRRLRHDSLMSAMLRCGLLGGAAAGLVHGLIDSDWSIPAVALSTAFVWGGCCNGACTVVEKSTSRAAWRWSAYASACVALCLLIPLSAVAILGNRAAQASVPEKLRLWQSAIRLAPWDPNVWHQYALAGAEAGESSREVIHALRRSIQLGQASKYHMTLALYQWHVLQEPDAAIRTLSDAVAADPTSVLPILIKGELLREQGRIDDAAKCWNRVLDLQRSPVGKVRAIPELVELGEAIALTELGCYEEQRGALSKAKALWRDAARILSKDAAFRKANPAMDIPSVGMKAQLLERTRALLNERGYHFEPADDRSQ